MSALPRLAPLHALDAAARHTSFVAAAPSLNVRASAVRPFLRDQRGVALAEAGRAFARHVSRAPGSLAMAVKAAREAGGRQRLSVVVPPSLAALRFMPRLSRFVVAFPDIEVNINTCRPA